MPTKLSISFALMLAGAVAAHHSGGMPQERAKSGERVPVIVELFTSEGCSSCPPADEALRRLASTQPVPGVVIVAMSEHVDYWNSLGWTDPFSSAQFSQRQDEYAKAFGLDGIYTPQMVVDGREEFIGNDVSKAAQAISRVASAPKRPFQLAAINVNADTVRLQVQIEPAPNGGSEDVYLAVTEDNLSSNVKRGENEGRVLAHTAVVRRLSLIGTSTGGMVSMQSLWFVWTADGNLPSSCFSSSFKIVRAGGFSPLRLLEHNNERTRPKSPFVPPPLSEIR